MNGREKVRKIFEKYDDSVDVILLDLEKRGHSVDDINLIDIYADKYQELVNELRTIAELERQKMKETMSMHEHENAIVVKCDVDPNDMLKIIYEDDPLEGVFVSFSMSAVDDTNYLVCANEKDAKKIRDFLIDKLG